MLNLFSLKKCGPKVRSQNDEVGDGRAPHNVLEGTLTLTTGTLDAAIIEEYESRTRQEYLHAWIKRYIGW